MDNVIRADKFVSLTVTLHQMSTKNGGDYGDVRTPIDLGKLNHYLLARAPAVNSPVTVKQFKVCS